MSPATQEKSPTHRGRLLKEARQLKGVSLETVHEHTKIPLDALRAIEEGYTVRMLSTFYQRGFTKIYAKYLGVDVKDVIDDFKEVKSAPATVPPPPLKKKEPSVDLKKKLDEVLTPERKQQIIVVAVVIVSLVLVFKILGWIIHQIQTRPVALKEIVVKQKSSASVKTKAKSAPRTETPRPAAAVPAMTPSVLSKPMSSDVLLTVRAKKNSWLRVKTDGKVVFESQLRLGSVESWKATQKIELAGKNLGELEFEVNGKMIGTLTKKDRQAKELIVTKDGLTVTK